VGAVDLVGILKLKIYHTVNIKMTFNFKHPNYYKELRKRNKLDQVISGANATAKVERAPGPGLKHQASSVKPQAASKPEPVQVQASSAKRQASQPE